MVRLFKTHIDAQQLKTLVSPVFFRLFPPRVVARQVARLAAGPLSQGRARETAQAPLHRLLHQDSVARLDLDHQPNANRWHDGRSSRTGDAALTIYFSQLFSDGASFLDLSFASFDQREQELVWTPSPVVYPFASDFREPLTNVYLGFYRGQQQSFDEGLRQLDLLPERTLMASHFGSPSESVQFSRAHFRDTFEKIFESCAARKARLHPDFIPLGVYLGTLYEHLDREKQAYRVADAFERGLALSRAAYPGRPGPVSS